MKHHPTLPTFGALVPGAGGVLGALLLAINGKHAGYGWLAFLASNAAWLHFAWRLDYAGLLAQTIGFTLTNPKINQPPTGGAHAHDEPSY